MTMDGSPPRPRVLVIDDDVLIGRVLARLLPACEITFETAPRAAVLRFTRGEAFDLVLCDLHMPEGNAADVILAARSAAPALAARVVVMTGGSTSGEDERFLDRCGAKVLLKPFEERDVNALVEWAVAAVRSP